VSDDNFAHEPKLSKGRYRHYKGNLYEVIGLACHSESLDWHVVYKPLYDHPGKPDIWIRPYEMFIEDVEINGKSIKRFTHIDSSAK
jgi:hypothetical protein